MYVEQWNFTKAAQKMMVILFYLPVNPTASIENATMDPSTSQPYLLGFLPVCSPPIPYAMTTRKSTHLHKILDTEFWSDLFSMAESSHITTDIPF